MTIIAHDHVWSRPKGGEITINMQDSNGTLHEYGYVRGACYKGGCTAVNIGLSKEQCGDGRNTIVDSDDLRMDRGAYILGEREVVI